MKQKTNGRYLFVIALALLLGTGSLAVAGDEEASKGASAQGKNKAEPVELKNFKQADKAQGESNAQIFTTKLGEVAENLKKAADKEADKGNAEVSEQIRSVATQQIQAQAQISQAIEKVETRGKAQTFFFGEDYKNLGQLRSEIVQNRDEIRRLIQALTRTKTKEGKALGADLATLLQEQERLKSVIANREGKFSLFGWLSRWMSGYMEPEADGAVDEQLAVEAQTAIDAIADRTPPSAPGI